MDLLKPDAVYLSVNYVHDSLFEMFIPLSSYFESGTSITRLSRAKKGIPAISKKTGQSHFDYGVCDLNTSLFILGLRTVSFRKKYTC